MGRSVVIQQCPQCKSSHIFYDLGGVTGRVYRCHDCGYIGPVVIEIELTEEEVRAYEEAKAELEARPETKKKGKRRKGFFRRT